MKLTTIFRHYSKFQSQWKVDYFEWHCDWEQLPNWNPSSDFKAEKTQPKTPKRRHPLAAAPASSLSPKTTPTPTRNAEQLADQIDGHNVPASIKHQCTQGPRSFYNGCCNSAGVLAPKRGGGERPKGGMDQTLHSTSWDSCIHTS